MAGSSGDRRDDEEEPAVVGGALSRLGERWRNTRRASVDWQRSSARSRDAGLTVGRSAQSAVRMRGVHGSLDLRRPPFLMTIENRLRTIQTADSAITISEYRYVPPTVAQAMSLF